MAFRLQSAIAGFAKRSSERLKALEEDTKELAKTEAVPDCMPASVVSRSYSPRDCRRQKATDKRHT